MMQRRSFLIGASALALSQGLVACNGRSQPRLNIHFLQNSLPPQLLRQFSRKQRSPLALNLLPQSDPQALFRQLQVWKQTSAPATPATRLLSLGDYWLIQAIRQELIQPLQPTQWANWEQLPQRWQALVTRDRQGDLRPGGQIWGAPYRWGATVLAYRTDKFRQLGWTPTDWSDLWRPELKRRFSLLDQPREVIGLTLKTLGHSYNSPNLTTIPNLTAQLQALQQQVKLYSSTAYLQPLIRGDTWLAMGWSSDILPMLRQYDNLAVVMPQAGTALWADVWVQPTAQAAQSASATRLSQEWIDFWWQSQTAEQLSQFTPALSPRLATVDPDHPTATLLLGDRPRFDRSEFLLPLSPPSLEQYRSLWLKIRR